MSWVNVGVAAVSAVSSANKAKHQNEQQQKNNMAQAEMTKYSDITGKQGQLDMSYIPSQFEAGVGGGMQGLAMAQSLKNMQSQQGAWDRLGKGDAHVNTKSVDNIDDLSSFMASNPNK
jgi:hypothetical protein